MEISRMITMSTGHITKETYDYLENKSSDGYGLCIYDKADFGYFIYMPTNKEHDVEYLKNLPKDLAMIFMFARQNEFDIVCLDCDGQDLDMLPIYDC